MLTITTTHKFPSLGLVAGVDGRPLDQLTAKHGQARRRDRRVQAPGRQLAYSKSKVRNPSNSSYICLIE